MASVYIGPQTAGSGAPKQFGAVTVVVVVTVVTVVVVVAVLVEVEVEVVDGHVPHSSLQLCVRQRKKDETNNGGARSRRSSSPSLLMSISADNLRAMARRRARQQYRRATCAQRVALA